MIIKIINGKIIGESETIADVRALLAYEKKIVPSVKSISTKKRKRACPKCGKKVKYLSVHDTVMHGNGRLLGAVEGDMARKVI